MSLSFWIRDYVFFPLASLRRELWWRNLVLVFSMVLFGLWHKASLLFVLWGCYHGVLLVLHRQVQQLERKFHWDPPERIWEVMSWSCTIALISLGWIFFRANSLAEAGKMFSAVVSLANYRSHLISLSLYLLFAALAGGYAIALLMADAFDRYSTEPNAGAPQPQGGVVALLARKRWYWIPPLYLLTLLIVWFVTFTQGGSTAQLMYRTF
jgi:alginate O-acetyltransferase complex protein AlgI